jgi:hypothetical protein
MLSLRRWFTRSRPALRRYRPGLEMLEDRCLLSTLTVINNNDSGTGSLRAQIAAASAGDTITFASGGLTGGQTITLTSGSLVPTVNVTITDAGAPAVSIVSATSRIFDFPLSSPSTLTAVTIQDLTLNGTANDGTTGGAIHIATISAFSLTIDSCNITGTLAGAGAATRGGAVSVTGLNDSLSVTNCAIGGTVSTVNTVSNNDAGALYVATNQTVSVTSSTLSGNVTGSTTSNEGGAVYQNSGTLNLTNCTLSGSSAGRGGGFYQQGGTANLTSCTISGNTATSNGGGVYLGKGTLNLTNCTIANNTAGNQGGGISAWFHSSNGTGGTSATNLTNCTISGNTAATAAGLYAGYIKPTTGINPTGKNTVTAKNTIIAGSVVRKTGGVITDSNESINASNSLFDTTPTTGAGMTLNGTNANNLFGMNPMLGSLQNNGGSTPTLALQSGSPAIDAGSNTLAAALTTDQRGFNRFVNGTADIGAYEFQQPATTTTVTSSLNLSQVGQSVTFTATVAAIAAGSDTLQGSVTFSVDGAAQASVTLSGGMATFTTSAIVAGSHTITASYGGFTSTAYSFSTSTASLTQTVTAPTTATTVNKVFAVSADAGGAPQVVVYNAATGVAVASFYAFAPTFSGGVRVAVADVNGDGTPDVIAAAGPGGGPQVEVIDGTKLGQVAANGQIASSALLANFYAFTPSFSGGVYVAAGVSMSGQAELVVGAGAGGGPQVEVIDGTKLGQVQSNGQIAMSALLGNFFAFAPTFAGGVRVAVGDVNGDGSLDVVTGAGPGGGPQVEVIDGTKLTQVQSNGQPVSSALLANFFAFVPTFAGGVFVSVGATAGGSQLNLIVSAGAANSLGPVANSRSAPGQGLGPLVEILNGSQLTSVQGNGQIRSGGVLSSFFALPSSFAGGVRVGFNGAFGSSGKAAILTAAGPGAGPEATAFDGMSSQALSAFYALPAGFSGGLFISG